MVRDIYIKPVLNGFVVTVGCQIIVVKSVDELADEVRKYYRDPHSTEKTYISNAVNRTMDAPCQPEPRIPVGRSILRGDVGEPIGTDCAPQEAPPDVVQPTGRVFRNG